MEINLQQNYCAFLDVLGFTDLVYSKDSKADLEKYFSSVEEIINTIEADKKELKLLSISDSIIISAPHTDWGFNRLLTAIQTFQCSLAAKDIWIRGGVASGPVHFDLEKLIIVGAGYIRAFKLEGEANFPRVIIDPIILNEQGKTLMQFNDTMNVDPPNIDEFKLVHDYSKHRPRYTDDDSIFVCYANKFVRQAARNQNADGLSDTLEKLLIDLRNRLYGKQEFYHKYLWLKKYFEEVLQEEAQTFTNSAHFSKFFRRYWTKFSDL